MDQASVRTGAPSGEQVAVHTFLIADIRGYSRFTAERGDEAAAALSTRMATIARDAVAARSGEVIELRGDEALAVFSSTRQALWAAAELQGRFANAVREDPSLPLTVGIGLDAGEAIPVEGGFRGAALNRAARLCSLAGPGEVLASDGVVHLAGRIDGLVYSERGTAQLKGFAEPVRIYGVHPAEVVPGAAVSRARSDAPDAAILDQHLPIGGFLGSLPAGLLVGRERELARGVASVDAVQRGEGRLVLLAGEPGVGKTRLAQEITLDLRNRGFLIAAGSCYEARVTSAFFPFLEVLATLYSLAPESLRGHVSHRFPYLAALLPGENLPVPPAPSVDGAQDRLLWSVSGFLSALAEQTPVAVLLDDLHWADSSSLELVLHLAHQTRRDRVLLLGTYRDVEVARQNPLERTLHELDRHGLTERVAVPRLAKASASALVAASFDEEQISPEFADLLYERTEGNPFFLQQVLRDLVERGDLYRQDGRWERKTIDELSVPDSIRSAVGHRLSRMSKETQEVLQRASVLGQSFAFEELLGLAELDEDSLERCLDEAAGAGIISTQDGEAYSFDHALTRQALYGELSPRKRRRLHRAAGEALEQLPEKRRRARLAELAWHFLQADAQEKALRWSLQAGDAARAVYAHADAEMQYRTAVELAGDLDDRAGEALALEQLADVLNLTSRYTEQLEIADRAAELYRRQNDLEGEGRVIARTSYAYWVLDRKREGMERLEELLRRFEGQPASPAHFALYEGLVTLRWTSGMEVEAEEPSMQALDMARQLGDRGLLARAWGRRALTLTNVEGRAHELDEAYAQAALLAEQVGDLETVWRVLNNSAISYHQRGDLAGYRGAVDAELATARRLANPYALALSLELLCIWSMHAGNMDMFRRYAKELSELARRSAVPAVRAFLPFWGALLMFEGNVEESRAELERCIADGESADNPTLVDEARWWKLSLDWWDGRLDAAREYCETQLSKPDLPTQEKYEVLGHLAAILLETGRHGDTEAARRALDEVRTTTWVRVNFGERTMALALSAWLIARDGNREEALRQMHESLDAYRSHGYVLWEGNVLIYLGLMLAELGELEAAQERLGEACELFRSRRMVILQRRAERLLSGIDPAV